MLSVQFKTIRHKTNGNTLELLVFGRLREQRNVSAEKIGDYNTNTTMKLFPSGKTYISTNGSGFSCIRPRTGLLRGVKITDPEALTSAIGLTALRWYNLKWGTHFKAPEIHPKFVDRAYTFTGSGDNNKPIKVTSKVQKSCLQCRWFRSVRMGSDEIGFDFSDEDGENLRELPKDMYAAAVQPRFQCTLFGHWLEISFGLMDSLNDVVAHGVKNSSRVNLREGFDSWPLDRFRQKRPMSMDPDEQPHEEPMRGDPTGEWGDLEWLRKAKMQDRACEFHRERSKFWKDPIPAGWMPQVENGVLIATTTLTPEV